MNKRPKIIKTTGLSLIEKPFDSTLVSNQILANYVHLVGFEFDGTACFRKGARLGPAAIRRASGDIETYSPYLDKDTSEQQIIDLGNLPLGESNSAEECWQMASDFFHHMTNGINAKDNHIKFLTIGGEHSISYAPIIYHLNTWPNLHILHLDAHADLRDGYEGYQYSHAAIIRRIIEHFQNGHRLIQYGIRSGTQDEFRWMKANNTLVPSLDRLFDTLIELSNDIPIYLTLDLDYFDPGFMPGTGTPEAGGETFQSFVELLKIIARKNLVGADVVELAPQIDATGNSSVFAAKIVRELLLALSPGTPS